MSLYDTLATDMATILADTAGPAIDATYTPKGSTTATACKVVFEREGLDRMEAGDGQTHVSSAVATIPATAASSVAIEDTLTVAALSGGGTEVWAVSRIREVNAAVTVAELVLINRYKLTGAEDERKRK